MRVALEVGCQDGCECGCEGGVEYYGEVSGGDGEDCFWIVLITNRWTDRHQTNITNCRVAFETENTVDVNVVRT